MTRDELDTLRQRAAWLRPQMHIELPVSVLRELLDLIELDDDDAPQEESTP